MPPRAASKSKMRSGSQTRSIDLLLRSCAPKLLKMLPSPQMTGNHQKPQFQDTLKFDIYQLSEDIWREIPGTSTTPEQHFLSLWNDKSSQQMIQNIFKLIEQLKWKHHAKSESLTFCPSGPPELSYGGECFVPLNAFAFVQLRAEIAENAAQEARRWPEIIKNLNFRTP